MKPQQFFLGSRCPSASMCSPLHAYFHAFLPDSVMLNPETMEYLERKNDHCLAFSTAMVMNRSDEAMSLVETGPKTVQEPVPKII